MSNRCDLTAPRDPPEDLLRELRLVDPLIDLHYLGEGVWIVGRVVPNAERAAIGGKMKRRREHIEGFSFSHLAVPELTYQGFGAFALHTIQGEPDSRIVTDARERDWRYRNRARLEFEERLDRSEGVVDAADGINDIGSDAWWDEVGYRERHIQPELFRARKHFPQGALHS